MLYCHDALGLGHVRRSLAIARSVLSKRSDLMALLVTCSPAVGALPGPPRMDYLKLPSARKLGNQRYVPRNLPLGSEPFRALRAALIRETAEHFDPDLTLVDKSPVGLMGELAGTLGALRRRSRPARIVLGLRDILDEPDTVAREWKSEDLTPFVECHYHEIWIYGDRDVFDAPAAYGWPDSLVERTRYLGYLVRRVDEEERREARRRLGVDDGPLALVTVGGGEDGSELIAAYLRAAEARLLPGGLQSVVVLGPCMALGTQAALAASVPDRVRVVAFVPDLAPAIAAADVVVCKAGYNTTCELLAEGTPAVMVPRTRPRREQWLRARALHTRGLAQLLEPQHLEPHTLAAAVRRALETGRTHGRLRTDGLEQVVRHVDRMLPPASWTPAEEATAELSEALPDRYADAWAAGDQTDLERTG